ncbi:hypothetical protein DICVIV_05451 [Dictyocaulus viviparus]|uniref:Uncharacterized protein n=1 Tax=Dictyocaulus viviparus TaxID=29172 RepID=A0A0D8XXB6_DICVI|nr:hypothetical protein DICVIV_05451 [Dictyocaulus viviparus]
MSPNLSSEHFGQNQILYEKVLMNVFSLVGIASPFTMEAQRDIDSRDSHRNFLTPESTIHIPIIECLKGKCAECNAKMTGMSVMWPMHDPNNVIISEAKRTRACEPMQHENASNGLYYEKGEQARSV